MRTLEEEKHLGQGPQEEHVPKAARRDQGSGQLVAGGGEAVESVWGDFTESCYAGRRGPDMSPSGGW